MAVGSGKAVFLLQTDPWRPKPVLRALREADALARAGWEVSFVSWIKDPSVSLGGSETFSVRRVLAAVPPLGTSMIGRALAYLRVSRRLREAVLADTPDLLIAHDFEVLSAAVSAGRRARIPVVYDSHEDWPALIAENSATEARLARIQERRLCKRVAHVLTVSDPIASKFRAMGKPTTVLYNARADAEVQRADRGASRARFGYAPSDFVIGFAGAIVAGRGLEVLLDAVVGLPKSVKALLVGGPEEEAHRLRQRADSMGVHDRVRIDGYRPFGEIAPYYASMDLGVILLDRRPNHERALPNKLFDYMAHGVPALVPEYPAMSAVVRESGSGIALPESDVEHVGAAIRYLMTRRSELESMGARGRNAFETRYCWERQEPAFLGIVREVTRTRA